MTDVDVAIVGGGIIGLAFATVASRNGKTVELFERSARPEGASVRNFGMIWPIGQRPGPDYDRAMRSRAIWIEMARETGIWLNPCGSLHLAHADDEMSVIEEFAGSGQVNCRVLSAREVKDRCSAVNPKGLRGGLWSATECAVNPRTAIARLGDWLNQSGRVKVNWRTAITRVEPGLVVTATGREIRANHAIVCSGSDFETLLPEVFAKSDIRRCKLQMLKTAAQPQGWQLGPHLAAGLTLTHYKSFDHCPTLPALKARFANERPDCVRFGIHVMASQQETGEVTIGDSHEYDNAISLFDRVEIDDLILDYLDTFVTLPDRRIDARWHGIYAKHPTRLFVAESVDPHLHIAVAPGGAGMTLSFGLAEEWFQQRGELVN
jgi:FAD dependent oxidoreductase TIGR03364